MKHWICDCEEGYIYPTEVEMCFVCRKERPYLKALKKGVVRSKRQITHDRNNIWLELFKGGLKCKEIGEIYNVERRIVYGGIIGAKKYTENSPTSGEPSV